MEKISNREHALFYKWLGETRIFGICGPHNFILLPSLSKILYTLYTIYFGGKTMAKKSFRKKDKGANQNLLERYRNNSWTGKEIQQIAKAKSEH